MRTAPWRIAATLLVLAALSAALPTPSRAARFTGIDASMSTIMQQHQSSFSGLNMRFRLQSDRLIQNIEILPSIEYWRNSSNLQAFQIETMRKDATIGIDVRYVFFNDGWEPYIGGGWALHFFSNRVNAPTMPNAEDSFSKGGLTTLGGVSVPITSMVQNFFEMKYHHVTENKQLKINWGLSVLF